jgi:hypothetical protein
MAIAYQEGGHHFLFVMRGEVAPLRRTGWGKTAYWALTALGFLAEHEFERFPVTQWTFSAEMWPAVLRLLEAKECALELLEKEEALARAESVANSVAANLNVSLDELGART